MEVNKKFGFKILYNTSYASTTYLVKTANIRNNGFYGLVSLTDASIEALSKSHKDYNVSRNMAYITDLMSDQYFWSPKIKHDAIRILNIDDYYKFSRILKLLNLRYNKKKNKIVKIK